MKSKKTIQLYSKYVVPCYAKTPLVLERGKGARLWDSDGNEYLDFFPGWAVSGIGHCPPKVTAAIQKQAGKLIHVSNNYYHSLQARLAETIIKRSFPGKVFFCNSGAEANEAAMKLVRKVGNPEKFEIITMERSFHGRTLAAISATGQAKYQQGFQPIVPGFINVPFNDFDAIERVVTERTAAIMLEPVQGEGGIRIADKEYLSRLRKLCDERKILLIFDEVQTGIGRTGRMFAFQHTGIVPDVMTLAKTLGGGFPIGAMVARSEFADALQPGTHATTFGGSPLACAASLAVFETIDREKLLRRTVEAGRTLFGKLKGLQRKFSIIREVRGIGLMTGAELEIDGKGVYERCLEKRLLINCTQGNVLRLMPPMTVTDKEIDRAIRILEGVLGEL